MSSNRFKKVCSILLVLTTAACGGGDDDGNTNTTDIACPMQCTATAFTPACETGTGALSDYKCSANLQTSVSDCSGTLMYGGQNLYTCTWTTLGGTIQTASCDGHGSCTYP